MRKYYLTVRTSESRIIMVNVTEQGRGVGRYFTLNEEGLKNFLARQISEVCPINSVVQEIKAAVQEFLDGGSQTLTKVFELGDSNLPDVVYDSMSKLRAEADDHFKSRSDDHFKSRFVSHAGAGFFTAENRPDDVQYAQDYVLLLSKLHRRYTACCQPGQSPNQIKSRLEEYKGYIDMLDNGILSCTLPGIRVLPRESIERIVNDHRVRYNRLLENFSQLLRTSVQLQPDKALENQATGQPPTL